MQQRVAPAPHSNTHESTLKSYLTILRPCENRQGALKMGKRNRKRSTRDPPSNGSLSSSSSECTVSNPNTLLIIRARRRRTHQITPRVTRMAARTPPTAPPIIAPVDVPPPTTATAMTITTRFRLQGPQSLLLGHLCNVTPYRCLYPLTDPPRRSTQGFDEVR